MTGRAAGRTGSRLRFRLVAAGCFLLFVLTALAAAVEARLRPPFGAVAQYYAGTTWTGPVRVRTIDPDLTTRRLESNWRWDAEPFSVRWDGWVIVPESARYRFAASSDDGSVVFIDDEAVVENGGRHEGRMVVGARDLTPGPHALSVRYFQAGGAKEIDVRWAPPGESLRTLEGPDLIAAARSIGELRWWSAALKARNTLIGATAVVYLAALALLVAPPFLALVRRELSDGVPRDVLALLAVIAAIYLFGIWWGLPGPGWAPDELGPEDYADAYDARFSGGWSSRYPPAQYQLVIAASLPLWLARAADPTTFGEGSGRLAVFLIGRLLSVAMATATVLLVYLSGRRLYDHVPALFSAAVFALMPPLAYYAKLANLEAPYLFWFAISVLAYLRLYDERGGRRDLLLYAAAATLAICTKDQAYGLFILPTAALAWRGLRPPSAVRAKDFLAATILSVLIFVVCHNIPLNLSGFLHHVRSITGAESRNFRIFDPGWAGQWAMLRSSGSLVLQVVGAPACALAAIAAAASLTARTRGAAAGRLWWVALPALSYYATFIAVVGYNYDRFFLPVGLTLSLFAGAGLALLLARGTMARRAASTIAGAAIAFALVRTMLIDVAMARDARYEVERWMARHAVPGATVGAVGLTEYLPRLEDFRVVTTLTLSPDEIDTFRARYLVVNAEFARRFVPASPAHELYRQLVSGGTGYRFVTAIQPPVPLARLSYQAALGDLESFTNLTKVNPAMLIFERAVP